MIEENTIKLLCCPICQGDLQVKNSEYLECKNCKKEYLVKNNIPVLLKEYLKL